jgi:hypothetical protein
MTAYLSRPIDTMGPYPAIIAIHEVWGLNEQIKGVTRRYANEGFAAIAPNLFTRQSDLLTEKNIAGLALALLQTPRNKALPMPAGAVLLSPWTDLVGTVASRTTRNTSDPIFTGELINALASFYAGTEDKHNPLISPINADLQGFPPLRIDVGSDEATSGRARQNRQRSGRAYRVGRHVARLPTILLHLARRTVITFFLISLVLWKD